MSKGLIILQEIPGCCNDCELFCSQYIDDENIGLYCIQKKITNNTEEQFFSGKTIKKPNWCPIKKMPVKKGFDQVVSATSLGWIEGWNACIDMIGG